MAATVPTSVLYEVDGAVATITMNRPEVANAQNTALIDELDAAFDRADADDDVRVVILAGAGKHFSSGHDLKALVGDGEKDDWVQMRETPEGKFHHEKIMYYDRCRASTTSASPPSPPSRATAWPPASCWPACATSSWPPTTPCSPIPSCA